MYGPTRIDRRNHRSLVIAGIGTIGKGLITLGNDQLSLFEHIVAVDKDVNCLIPLQNSGITCRAGDITNPQFLQSLMSAVPAPSLFINLCSGTDNIIIRNSLKSCDTAYLDSCASVSRNQDEFRFSRLMPYTYTAIDICRPHWLCWGINPGLVEIITRRILSDLPDNGCSYDVNIYEFDRLENRAGKGRAAVGWCPEALVEELMLSPTMEIIAGQPKEDSSPGTRSCLINWENRLIPARVAGHEDIWNLAGIPAVKNGRFYYSLSPAVMNILTMDDAGKARGMLYIPSEGDVITGLEQVAVQVSEENLQSPAKTLVWTEDHAATWKQFGVNAVQYQTAKSLLLAVMLLQRTDYGLMPLSLNASSLPITAHEWPVFDSFMQDLDINWHDGTYLNLHLV